MTGKEVLALPSVGPFLDHFQVGPQPFDNPDGFVEALRQLDPRYKGDRPLVRYELEQDQASWSPEAVKIIMACAKEMRMLETETFPCGGFELVIVLGGARQSNLERARFAARCAHKRHCDLIVAGSSRKLNEAEQQNVANYAPNAKDEFDLCAAAAKIVTREFGVITSLFLVENERAGTPDVLEAVIQHGNDSPDGVLAVTTQIYQLATELDLRRVAKKYGIDPVDTEAAGCPSDPGVVAKRTPATYLSEVLRTLRAATLATQAGA